MNKQIARTIARGIATIGATIALCLGATGCASSADTADKTITVSATNNTMVTPDVASISVSITTRGADPSAASKANSKPTKAVIAALKDLGVDKKDIQTSYTDLSPYWNDEDEPDGYEMRTVLDVKGLAIEDVSKAFDACIGAGATEVNGPNYYVSSYDEAYQEALTAAIEATRPKAEAIAKASGVTLGKVVSVTEGYQDMSYAANKTLSASEELGDAGGVADVEPGEVSITADITVSYAIL